MKLGLMLGYSGAELKLPVELVQRAEALGFDSVWTAEAYGSDATSPLAYLAAVTKRIRLGTWPRARPRWRPCRRRPSMPSPEEVASSRGSA